MASKAKKLKDLLAEQRCYPVPCCWDALSAQLIEQAGFPFTFMSGFAVSASRIGAPDQGLISYGEMVDQGRNICNAVSFPVIGDGDTGYGNAMNVKRTVGGYAGAGFACVMIEDQVSPKRCGHVAGKHVVGRGEALERVQAAVDARNEGADILVMARTDARANHGLDEAIWRAQRFSELGADILFVEAPETEEELGRITREAPGIHAANIIEGGVTPFLPPDRLHQLGYRFAVYPLTMFGAAMKAMNEAMGCIAAGQALADKSMPFGEMKRVIGFDRYGQEQRRYSPEEDARKAS
jgi:2-methylisocitrate lyase-like PEP mutase family enzyme